MRKLMYLSAMVVLTLLTVFVTTACKDRAANGGNGDEGDSTSVDSLSSDSLDTEGLESVMPDGADELFDDFFFNFAANKQLQYQRIVFPLPVNNGKQTRQITKQQWQMDYFFMEQGYYTLILDNIKQLELANDTAMKHVIIERIQLDSRNVRQYVFDRKNGLWMMTSINENSSYMPANASFLQFYEKFAADEDFQIKSMDNLVTFTGPDPDDDFSTITGQIAPEQWPAFKPSVIPEGTLYNIIYGQDYKDAGHKVLLIRGIANGVESELTFKKKGNAWKLVKFNC